MDESKLRKCVHCGLCLEACPTYRLFGNEADSPRGRILLMRGVAEGRIPMTETVQLHLDRCLACRACETACPAGVPYGELIEDARMELYPRISSGKIKNKFKKFLLNQTVANPKSLRLAGKLLKIYRQSKLQSLLRKTKIRKLLPSWMEKGEKLLPSDSAEPTQEPTFTEKISPQHSKGKVLIFRGCIASILFPDVEKAAVKILQTLGYSPTVQETTACCGALHLHAGYREETEALAQKNLATFRIASYDFLAVTSAGCGSVLKEYSRILSGSPKASAFSGKVRDISELIAPYLHEIQSKVKPLPLRVAYQDACHLSHGQRIREEPRKLLTAIPSLELLEIPDGDQCCGSAGIYNLTHPEESQKIGEEKIKNILSINPDAVAVGNPGCLLQIRMGLEQANQPIPVVHPIEILAARLP